MPSRPVLLVLAAGVPLALGSCGLFRLPVRAVGAVVEGGAYAGKTIGKSAAKPFAKTPEEKEEAAKKKAAEDQKKLDEKRAKLREDTDRHAAAQKNANAAPPDPANPGLVPDPAAIPDLPAAPDTLPPLPEGY